jgi:23S rRNA (cytosine1962-C5)-methyltransferase
MTHEEKFLMFENRLKKVKRIVGKQAQQQQVSCYRLYDRDLPEFPLIIDLYENEVLVTEYKSQHRLTEDEYEQWLFDSLVVIEQVLEKQPAQIHLKERKRKSSRYDQYQKLNDQKDFFEVREGGLSFFVNLTDYLDTGLFIDHRMTRDMVRKEARNKRVLNLFCYTGSFSVYAASGGAQQIVSVDLSNTYLDWAKRNMELNGFTGSQFTYIKADVMQWLPGISDGCFDIIVLDPPTFSNSKSMKDIFDIQLQHIELINTCLQKLDHGGVLYFSTNARKFQLETSEIRGGIKEITTATTPFDFKGKLMRWCYRIEK